MNKVLSIANKLLPKSTFVRGVGMLVGGTAGAQALMLFASPLLTRLYGPDEFGAFAVYVAILSVVTVISSFRYHLAIPGAENDEDAINLLALCLVCAAFLSVVTGVVLFFWSSQVENLLSVSMSASVSSLLVLGVFLSGVFQAINYWAVREKAYHKVARAKIQKSLGTLAIQLAGYGAGAISLLGGHIIGHAILSFSLFRNTLINKTKLRVSRKVVKKQAWRYRQFPMYSTWGGLLNSAGMELPSILFASLFSPAVAGIYMLSHRVLASPAGMVNQAVGQVFFGHAREERDSGRFDVYTKTLHKHLCMMGAPVAVSVFIFAPHVFGPIFGQEWKHAGGYAQWLSVMIYFQFVSSPLTNIFNILELQKKTLAYNLVLITLRLVGIFFGVLLSSEHLAVMLFSLLSALGYLVFIYGTTGAAGVRFKNIILHHAKSFAVSVLLLFIPYFLLEIFHFRYFSFLLAIIICSSYYFYYYMREVKNA